MLKKDKDLIMTFLMNCYDNKVFNDELSKKEEKMYRKLWELEDILNDTQSKIYVELESLISDVIRASKERYFEYGSEAQNAVLEDLTFNLCEEKTA